MSYYENYYGPILTKATINDEDVTEIIRYAYGDKNWQNKLWKFEELFQEDYTSGIFYCEFEQAAGDIKYWYKIIIQHMDEVLNPPMSTPVNQNSNL